MSQVLLPTKRRDWRTEDGEQMRPNQGHEFDVRGHALLSVFVHFTFRANHWIKTNPQLLMSPPAVQENAETLFYSDAPQMICSPSSFHHFSLALQVDNDQRIYSGHTLPLKCCELMFINCCYMNKIDVTFYFLMKYSFKCDWYSGEYYSPVLPAEHCSRKCYLINPESCLQAPTSRLFVTTGEIQGVKESEHMMKAISPSLIFTYVTAESSSYCPICNVLLGHTHCALWWVNETLVDHWFCDSELFKGQGWGGLKHEQRVQRGPDGGDRGSQYVAWALTMECEK